VKTVAVVEDNEDNRLLMRALLEGEYALDEYGDGPSALAGMFARPPDLVLLDISLPGMDGNEVLAQLRADVKLSGLPVIALTAHAMVGDRERFLAAGFDDYITKPIVDDEALFDSIRRLLSAREARA
jgi:CheY-like chemotaxis protein